MGVVRPHSAGEMSPAWREAASHLVLSPPPFLSQQGFYSQLNISTENLIRICKSLGRGECNN